MSAKITPSPSARNAKSTPSGATHGTRKTGSCPANTAATAGHSTPAPTR